ncbi:uncharacterized protein N0V96_007716 [Colletotrichum fioriniae]|uniref:uncharacterized protein n=1 Tax=Colletotrichum fioriniae TaxID=710243 RepID=UPI0032DB4909|nr:hypothetical protein N0V96_007716 [Colletotrichum fioriniae]
MRKPQQTSGTPAETYTKEMNMATDTENKEQAEIYERFCTNVANESRPSNQRKTRPKWIEKDQYPGADFDICNPYGTESNAQAPFKSNQAPFQGNQAPFQGNQAPFQGNQAPYGGDGGEARAQAGTSSQAKELFPRERERDSENSQPRNDRSRSPPAQRGRSLADRISFPKKENTILHTVVDSPRLG